MTKRTAGPAVAARARMWCSALLLELAQTLRLSRQLYRDRWRCNRKVRTSTRLASRGSRGQ